MRSHVSRYPTPAHTYYVDATNGLDANRGNGEDAPWKTLSKVNGRTLITGDRVLFKRGETFSGILYPQDHGSTRAPILFGAYGSGNRPVIVASGNLACTLPAATSYFLRFDYLDFSGCNLDGAAVVDCPTHDIYFYDCIFRDGVDGRGLAAWASTGENIYNIIVDSCEAYNNDGSGITSGSSSGDAGPHNILIRNCTCHDNGTVLWADHGIYIRHGAVIENCICYDNAVGAGIKINCEGNHTNPYYPIVRNNITYGNKLGFVLDNINGLIYNNLTYSNTTAGLNMSVDTEGCLIYHNTVINTVTGGSGLLRMEGDYGTPSNITLKNNLFIQDAAVADLYVIKREGGTCTIEEIAAANDFNYNLYYHDATGSGGIGSDGDGAHTWATWQASGSEPNGTILSNVPDFVTRYTDLHPADGGDLKALGIAISGYEQDKDGNFRANPPTQGCYEESSP